MAYSTWQKLSSIFVLCASLGFSGCKMPEVTTIDPENTDANAPKIECSIKDAFNNPKEKLEHCVVNASDLKEDVSYLFYRDRLEVNGDLPKNTRLDVRQGKVKLNGSLNEGSSIFAKVPERHGRTSIDTSNYRQFKGYKDIDDTPAIHVTGDMRPGSFARANYKIQIDGKLMEGAEIKTEYDAPIIVGHQLMPRPF